MRDARRKNGASEKGSRALIQFLPYEKSGFPNSNRGGPGTMTHDIDIYGDKMESLFLARPSNSVALAWLNYGRSMRMPPFVVLWWCHQND